ncbi:MAG: methylmalonyl Co-A mutase-associated GTPase MeaB [Anaerolineae bacterium]
MNELITPLLNGNRRALARLLTLVENQAAEEALMQLFPHTGRAWVIGVTGAPGTGKSSLVNALAKAFRAEGKTVGIVAVDPTSPFTGGAILGDRIRMRDLSGDPGVFIRSMATRGSLGGLASTTRDAVRVLDAAGFDVVLIETVGAGQSEVDIVRTAQTTLVVEAPGLGDDIQAIKAGILEIADVLVVNKADRPEAPNTVRALRAMLEMGHPVSRTQSHHGRTMQVEAPPHESTTLWIPPVVQTVATHDTGIRELLEAMAAHREYLKQDTVMLALERQRIEVELIERLRTVLLARLLESVSAGELAALLDQIQKREIDPQQAVYIILSRHALVN